MGTLHSQVVGLDVHRKTTQRAVRCQQERSGKLLKQVRAFGTMTRDPRALADYLTALGVTHVPMEATARIEQDVLWPERGRAFGAFIQKLTITHVRNWQENRRRVGYGHLYQGRHKSFPVQLDDHFYQVVRYVERNAPRANLVSRAED